MNDPTAHAEVLGLREAARRRGNYRLSDATLYATIEPCAMCAAAIVNARIKRLVHGAPDPRAVDHAAEHIAAQAIRADTRMPNASSPRGTLPIPAIKIFSFNRQESPDARQGCQPSGGDTSEDNRL